MQFVSCQLRDIANPGGGPVMSRDSDCRSIASVVPIAGFATSMRMMLRRRIDAHLFLLVEYFALSGPSGKRVPLMTDGARIISVANRRISDPFSPFFAHLADGRVLFQKAAAAN